MTDYDDQPARPYPSAGGPRPVPADRPRVDVEDVWPTEKEREDGLGFIARARALLATKGERR